MHGRRMASFKGTRYEYMVPKVGFGGAIAPQRCCRIRFAGLLLANSIYFSAESTRDCR